MAKKDSFILYTEQKAVIDKLSDEQAGKLIKAIYEYVSTEEMPELDSVLDLVITPFKTILDKDKESYEKVCKIRAEAGSKGGKQKKQMQTKGSKCDDNDNEYDNDINKKKNIKKKYGENENVKFTDEEFEKIKAYFPNDYMARIQNLDDYIQMTGKKYKDFVATLKNWARKEGYKPPNDVKPKEEQKIVELDMSQLNSQEYDLLLKGKITEDELIKKGRIHVR